MIQKTFFYTPSTGSKLIAARQTETVTTFLHANKSYTCVGGVHICIGGSSAPSGSLRAEFAKIARLAVEQFGGAAFDERGNITICVNAAALHRLWKTIKAVRHSDAHARYTNLPPAVALPLMGGKNPPITGGEIDENGFIAPKWSEEASFRLAIYRHGRTFKIENESGETWVFDAEILGGTDLDVEPLVEPLDPQEAWEKGAEAGAYVETEKIRAFLESRKDEELPLFLFSRTIERLGSLFAASKEANDRSVGFFLRGAERDRGTLKALAKALDFEGFKGLSGPAPAPAPAADPADSADPAEDMGITRIYR